MALKNEKPQKGQPNPKKGGKLNKRNAKYVHGVTRIDRTKACPVPKTANGGEQQLDASLLRGKPRCRYCYKQNMQPCDCGKDLYETEVDIFWTRTSGYYSLLFPVVRKVEDIAILEAKRLGMSCVIIRKEQHNTYTQRDQKTGRRTGVHPPSDWHITVYLGDAANKLLLEGHCYVFCNGNGSNARPQCKLNPGNRTILEPHELLERLTLKDAAPDVYWGMEGSCGWDYF